MIAAFTAMSGERKTTSNSRNERPMTHAMNHGTRRAMKRFWSMLAAVAPPT